MYYSWYVVFYRRRLRGSSTFFSSAASSVCCNQFWRSMLCFIPTRASSVVPRLETPLVAVAVWCENYNYYGLRATTVEVSDAC